MTHKHQHQKFCETRPTLCTCNGNKDKCAKKNGGAKNDYTPVGFNVFKK